MIAGGRQERTADDVMRLRELAHGHFRRPAVVDEVYRPAPRYVGVVGRGTRKEAIAFTQGGVQRHVLILAA